MLFIKPYDLSTSAAMLFSTAVPRVKVHRKASNAGQNTTRHAKFRKCSFSYRSERQSADSKPREPPTTFSNCPSGTQPHMQQTTSVAEPTLPRSKHPKSPGFRVRNGSFLPLRRYNAVQIENHNFLIAYGIDTLLWETTRCDLFGCWIGSPIVGGLLPKLPMAFDLPTRNGMAI